MAAVLFAVYVSDYAHADADALDALRSDDRVTVEQTDFGWRFDGPSKDSALIFYPGGKVEETAYAPFLHQLAAGGMDVCLVKMPFRLAVFAPNAANRVLPQYSYRSWYVGGHSLGGAMAAVYAASHGQELEGVILCAAYPTKPLDDDLTEVLLYGTEDTVLRSSKVEEGDRFAPERFVKHAIAGGNHAQFGNYGPQAGDGEAEISWGEQQGEAVETILRAVIQEK